jgi:hypothetical protein
MFHWAPALPLTFFTQLPRALVFSETQRCFCAYIEPKVFPENFSGNALKIRVAGPGLEPGTPCFQARPAVYPRAPLVTIGRV